MTIGARLKDERTRLRLSQTELALAAGVSKNTQINYEKDERTPDASYLIAIASVGVDVSFVLFNKAEKTSVESLDKLELEIIGFLRGMSEESRKSMHRIAFALSSAGDMPERDF